MEKLLLLDEAIKANNAFKELAKKLKAGEIIGGSEVDFSSPLEDDAIVYLWDIKYGIDEITWPSVYTNLGFAILEGSVEKENTRFSHIAISTDFGSILTLYQTTMPEVKKWKKEFLKYDYHFHENEIPFLQKSGIY